MPNFSVSHKRVKVPARMADPWLSRVRTVRPGFEANAPRSGPRSAGFGNQIRAGTRARRRQGAYQRLSGASAMKLFTGWVVAAGLALAATRAQAQLPAPHVGYTAASAVSGPYAAMPPDAPVIRYGYGPTLLPPPEGYTGGRQAGFCPPGIPQQRGGAYPL